MAQERICKYGCGMQLGGFDTKNNKYLELDGTLHTREGCESLKNKQQRKLNGNGNHSDISLEVVLHKLKSIGVTIDPDVLRNAVKGTEK